MLTDYQKTNQYNRLFLQLELLLQKSPSIQSQMATINAVLYHKITYVFWVGFYILHTGRLIVGPYQGPLACQELEYPNGACWNAISQRKSLIIRDVNKFPGHISCDPRSKSELVIPISSGNKEIFGVIDLDSDKFDAFNQEDEKGISKILELLRIEDTSYSD
jgi:L-methionine (R)-S-oxide reductase